MNRLMVFALLFATSCGEVTSTSISSVDGSPLGDAEVAPRVTTILPSASEACGFSVMGNTAGVVALACDQYLAVAMALDGTRVYWATQGPESGESDAKGQILSVPKVGGLTTTLASGRNPVAMAVDSSNVYWTETSGAVLTIPASGGTPRTLAAEGAGAGGIAVNSTRVYWCDEGGTLTSTRIAGGDLESGEACSPGGIAASDSTVYWTQGPDCDQAILAQPAVGGPQTTLASHQSPHGSGFVGTPTGLDWTNGCVDGPAAGSGSVLMSSLGGTPSTLLTTGTPVGLAVAESGIYWSSDANGARLSHSSLDGGDISTVAAGDFAGVIAADTKAAYLFAGTTRVGVAALVGVTPRLHR